jgi:hypothetical protein
MGGEILCVPSETTMTAHDVPTSRPPTEWFQRFAGRLLTLEPHLRPLEAVRQAMLSFPDSRLRDPELAAQDYAAHEWPAHTRGAPVARLS